MHKIIGLLILNFSFFVLTAMDAPIHKRKVFEVTQSDDSRHSSREEYRRLDDNYKDNETQQPAKLARNAEQISVRRESKVVRVDEKNESVIKAPRFVYDAYTERRGEPKMLEIRCAKCHRHVMSYQKDGPGALIRCYLDRIHAPQCLKERQFHRFDARTSPNLNCSNCRATIGVPMMYHFQNRERREIRPAYRMIKGQSYF